MLYILLGLAAAMTVGLGAQFALGTEALLQAAWLEPLFWALVGAGVAMAVIDNVYCAVLHCPLRRLLGRVLPASCPQARCGRAT